MFARLAITRATDACSPIADNAGGDAERTRQQPCVRHRTDALDDDFGQLASRVGLGESVADFECSLMLEPQPAPPERAEQPVETGRRHRAIHRWRDRESRLARSQSPFSTGC